MDDPENEKSDHRVSRDALRFRNIIVQRQIARPDGPDHDSNRIGPVYILNREPKYRKNQSRNDGNIRSPETPAGTRNDGERNVVNGADRAVPRNDEGHDEEGDGHNGKRFAIGQPDGNNTTGELPSSSVEGIGNPVS